eukprot:12107592-Alexandrium_andersonii.AAC.1
MAPTIRASSSLSRRCRPCWPNVPQLYRMHGPPSQCPSACGSLGTRHSAVHGLVAEAFGTCVLCICVFFDFAMSVESMLRGIGGGSAVQHGLAVPVACGEATQHHQDHVFLQA